MKPAFILPTKLILPLGVLPGVPVGTFVVRSVGHLGKKKFKRAPQHLSREKIAYLVESVWTLL